MGNERARLLSKSVSLPNALELPYVEQGDALGVPVVLLHAYADSWRSFERVLPHLPFSIRALAPSQRGHGEAGRPDHGYMVEDFAGDLAAFMDALELDRAVLVASSSASFAVQRFAIDRPDRVLGLVLIGVPWSLGDKLVGAELSNALRELGDLVDPEFVRDFVQSTVSGAAPPDFLETMVEESLKVPAHVWQAALDGLLAATPPTETGTISAPTLIVWGDRDDLVPRSDQERLAGAILDSQLVVYQGAGHLVHWEEPERVAADIAAFVGRLPA